MAKVGRPKWMPPHPDEVEKLAARGLIDEEIALALGISPATLYERKREFVEFTEAIKKGRAKGIGIIANKLFEAANKGNITAQIFYLKCRAGWKETQVNEHHVDVNKLSDAELQTLVKN